MQIDSIINNLWPVFSGFVFFVAWLVRLEAKVLNLENDKNSMGSRLSDMQKTLMDISNSLARLEGRLEVQKD